MKPPCNGLPSSDRGYPCHTVTGPSPKRETQYGFGLLFTRRSDCSISVGFRERRHQRTRDIEEIRWIQKYVSGIEWTPWERPKEDKKEPPVISSAGSGR